jgi:hypothetical protein
VHHEGDLLSQAPAAAISRKSPAQEVILAREPDGTDPPPRWIRVNYLLWTAAGSGADYLVTNNTALLASNGEPYPIAALTLPGGEAPQTTTYSVSLDTFIDHELSKYPFDLEKVDGELLITATTGELSHGAASN